MGLVARAFLGTLVLMAVLPAQDFAPGPQVAVILSDVDSTSQPYALYVPRNFDAAKKYPLVISLHEEASNHRLNLRRVFGLGNRYYESDAEAAGRPFPPFPNVDYIVASPLARGTLGYQGIPEKDVYDVLADVKKRFPIDEDRIYLTGISSGGGGALWLALTRPDIWAAIAVVCPIAPPGADELAPNALNMPVRLFQGALDPMTPAAASQVWQARLQNAGAKVEYTEYPLVKHNAWDYAYRGASIFGWFSKFKRDRFPAQVRFTTRWYEYSSCDWVELDGLTPGQVASMDAKFTAPNQVDVKTTGLDGFTLRLAGHPMYDPSRPVLVQADNSTLKAGPHAALSFARTEKGWSAGRYFHAAGSKRPGLEGPIREAISRRHIYVYGTADSPDEQELQRRRAQAELAANWGTAALPLLLTLRTVADKDLTEDDLRGADLVLFGNKDTNSLIARFASRLPMELNPGAADYGLVFIAAVGDRYILVDSGLPWWAGATGAAPYRALAGLGDFVLFRRSLGTVVAEGSFDGNWKVPAELAAKMTKAGVVEIR